jgi:Tol biopolymer transport system component
MTHRDDLDQLLSTWLDDPYTPPAPAYLSQVLEQTRQTRQRRAWANLERWLPMASEFTGRTATPPLRLAWLLIIGLLVVALVAAVAVVGSRLLNSPPAIPEGGAAVLVFASQQGGMSESPVGDIYTVRADGTDLRQLTNASSAGGLDEVPVWSPDGTRIAFRGYHGSNNSVEVMDAAGGNRITLWTSGIARDAFCAEHDDLAWSPDGRTIIFAAHEACPGEPALFVVPADGSSQAGRLLASGMNGVFPRFSADGRRIAFLGGEINAEYSGLHVAEVGSAGAGAGGLQARRISPTLEGSPGEQWFSPRWSPDGTELAVAMRPFDQPGEIVVVKADGSGQRVLASDQATNPTWSPDGKRIAFHRIVDRSEYFADRPCTMRVWVMNADGTGERRLDPLVDGCVLPPIWSPDGTRLLSLVISDDAFHVGVFTVDGNDPPVVFTESYGASWQPVAAPLPPAPSFTAASPTP